MAPFRFLSKNLAPLTLAGAVTAYVFPPSFLVFGSSFLWFFAATMLALGVVLEPADLRTTLRSPHRVALGVLTQYTVMPLLGYAAARLSGFPPALALGFVIVGAAPGAMASNVIVYLAGGALAFSIAMTTVATFLSPLLTPSLVQWLGGAFLPVAFWPLFRTIVWTVLVPLVLGMGIRRLLGRRLEAAEIICPGIASAAIVVICSYAVAVNQERIATVGPRVFLFVVAVNALGYLAGWFLAILYRFDRRHQLALAIEIGMQNAGLGVALALEHFDPETALPGALFAAWCVLTAAGASAALKHRAADQ
jgi:BASS family bile acid:Na+ symporter